VKQQLRALKSVTLATNDDTDDDDDYDYALSVATNIEAIRNWLLTE
jgi:hypothetical protein